tara:strand:+ start:7576 stop:8730 length:1155 start_codon:yes stop_codon:yes gene_type:complete
MATLFAFATIINVDVYAASVHGVFKVVKGKVHIVSAKTGKKKRAKVGKKVYPGDTITTQKNARVKIVMIDKNEINVSPDSEVKLEKYEYDPSAGKKDVLLNVIYGKVRNKVKQKYDGNQAKFRVKTPSAVAGVRGTDFLTNFNRVKQKTEILTFEGRVQFGVPGAGGLISNAVSVGQGQVASLTRGSGAPSPPVAMDQSRMARFDQATDADKAPDLPDERNPANNPDAGDIDNQGPENGDPNSKGPEGGDGANNVDGSAGGIAGEGPGLGGDGNANGDPSNTGGNEFTNIDPNSPEGGGMMISPEELAGDADLSIVPVDGDGRLPASGTYTGENEYVPPPPPVVDPVYVPINGDYCGDLCRDPSIIDNIQGGTRLRVIITQPGG